VVHIEPFDEPAGDQRLVARQSATCGGADGRPVAAESGIVEAQLLVST
jgi:hypothetical protein